MHAIKKFSKANWRKGIVFAIVLLTISLISAKWVLFDQTPYDGPKGFGFPFAFYIGGGGLAYDPDTQQIGVPPYVFEPRAFVLDLLVWIAISLALSLSIIWVAHALKNVFGEEEETKQAPLRSLKER